LIYKSFCKDAKVKKSYRAERVATTNGFGYSLKLKSFCWNR